jgi:dTDP-4-amino-4,6-dideoxygalactose transaminase
MMCRKRNAEWYDTALEGLPLTKPPRPSEKSDHSWHLYPIQLHGGSKTRVKVIRLFAEREIGYSVHYTPLHRLTYWAKTAKFHNVVYHMQTHTLMLFNVTNFPNTEQKSK